MLRVTLLSVILSVSGLIRASESIGFTGTSFSAGGVSIGGQLIIQTKLKNFDSQSFNDSIKLRLSVNGNLVPDGLILSHNRENQQVNVAPNDSLSLTITINVQGPYFAVGPNGLVIWPIFEDSSSVHDSIFYQMQAYPTGIANVAESNVQVRHVSGMILIQSTTSEQMPVEVELYDAAGRREISAKGLLPVLLPESNLPVGLHFINIQINATRRELIRWIKN